MSTDKAKTIIEKNLNCSEGSFVSSLSDKALFLPELFWEYYESIATLVAEEVYSEELLAQISVSYQNILKLFIYHFSERDSCHIMNFPEDYNGYIERLDYAVRSYYAKHQMFLDESIFELPKQNQIR